MQEGGYHTLISGKWHLGFKPDFNPAARGFDRSLALLPGAANHYAYEPQFAKDEYLQFFEKIPALYTRDGKKEEFPPNVKDSKEGFYTTDYYTDNLLDYLKDWDAGKANKNESSEKPPFFAYLPFTAPHWPLQCAKEDHERYKGMYDDGPDALRERRFASLKKLGIHKDDVEAYPVVAPKGYSEWEELTPDEKKLSAKSMEVFAGMVTA